LFAETVRDGPRWFDSRLGLGQAGREVRQDAPVRLFVMGSRTWQEFSMWPPAGTTEQWYLGRGGTLGRLPASTRDSTPDRYHYNPSDPTPSVGGPSLNMTTAGRKEQSRRERRRDVLTYTSPPLTDDLTVIGPVTATLYVRSSLEHTDFFVRLCDVTAKGKSFNLSDGIVRLTPGSVPTGDDGVAELVIAMWPTANTFRAGHRIRLQVSSGAHPLFNRNAGTGEPLATGANLRSADQELFHDAGRPSSVSLHVVPLLEDGALGGRGMGSPDPLG
jgi:putative CocE/NonD family hydrolase